MNIRSAAVLVATPGRKVMLALLVLLFSEDGSKQLQSIERVIGRQFKREHIPIFTAQRAGTTRVIGR